MKTLISWQEHTGSGFQIGKNDSEVKVAVIFLE